ncbi:MAG: CppA family protein [Streptococcaceae bacterium]|jgi:catechol 2,3-dioxygenase-like lactoylglutathione lyase family enzyme|nr:CppA family protein [Streptococcaceae bacterium]
MIDSILKNAKFKNLALRINHRASNIAFYQDKLGFKKVLEEGALTLFGTKDSKSEKFVLEETPGFRGRKPIDNVKKVKTIYFQISAEDFTVVSCRAEKIILSEAGKVAYFTSPEEDVIALFTGELSEVGTEVIPELKEFDTDFRLNDYTLVKLKLNVSNLEVAIQKYEQIFDLNFEQNRLIFPFEEPFILELIEADGKELEGFVEDLWDIEYFELQVAEQSDLRALADYFETQNLDYFIDDAQTILTVKDASELEWFFTK